VDKAGLGMYLLEVLLWKLLPIRVVLFYTKLLKDLLSESLPYENLIWELISASTLHLPTPGHFSVLELLCPP
jgi:hypothetical protein